MRLPAQSFREYGEWKMKISGAIFDMDGTLLDSMHVWDGLAKSFANSRGFTLTKEQEEQIDTMCLDEAADFFVKEFDSNDTKEDVVKAVVSLVSDRYEKDIKAKDGVSDFLKELKKQGVKTAVATANDVSMVEAALSANGILEYFDVIMTCAMVGVGKEKPDIYLEAMKRLNTPKDETLVFEDALYAAKTASNAGFNVIGIYDESAKNDADEMKKTVAVYAENFKNLMDKIK